MASLVPLPKFYATDDNGRPVSGGQLFTYEAGSDTKLATYTTSAGNVENTNPVVMDTAGRANVWVDGSKLYKWVFSPADDTDPPADPFWTVDNVGLDAGGVSFIQAGSGAVRRTSQSKMREVVSILDFGASTAGSAAANATAIQAAIDSLRNLGGLVLVPDGTYSLTSLSLPDDTYDHITISGSSTGAKLAFTTTGTAITLGAHPGGIAWVTFTHLTLSAPNSTILADIKNGSFLKFHDVRVTESGNTGGTASRGFKLFASMQTSFDQFIYSGNVNAYIGVDIADDSDATAITRSYIKGEPTESTYSLSIDAGVTSPANVNTTVSDSIIGGGNTASIIIARTGDAGPIRIINNSFEGPPTGTNTAVLIQVGNFGGVYYGRSVEISGNYFSICDSDAVLLQACNKLVLNNNKFNAIVGKDVNFNTPVANNSSVEMLYNTFSVAGISMDATQNRVLFQDENGYVHDRLGALTTVTGDAWDPGSIADGDKESKDVTITGAALGDFAIASFNLDIQGLTISAAVKSANTVTVTLANNTGGAIDLASGIVYVRVFSR